MKALKTILIISIICLILILNCNTVFAFRASDESYYSRILRKAIVFVAIIYILLLIIYLVISKKDKKKKIITVIISLLITIVVIVGMYIASENLREIGLNKSRPDDIIRSSKPTENLITHKTDNNTYISD